MSKRYWIAGVLASIAMFLWSGLAHDALRLATFGARAGFITLVGVLAAITTNIPYWNWYGFPTSYTVAYMFIEIIGFLVAGLVAAAVLRKGAGKAAGVAT